MIGRVAAVSVSGGRQVPHNGQIVGTGIFKEPVQGRVMARRLGFEGDRQVDLRYHGGEHKAVYAYPHEHYAAWAAELRRDDLGPGQFGENLTTEGLLETTVHVGDRFRAGGALLEVTQPRVPCFKLGIKMGDPEFPKIFLKSMRCGFYLRVIEEGAIGAGDPIERVKIGPEQITIHALYHLRFKDALNKAEIQRALSMEALSKEWRRELSGL
jgi:MOSC domain-containing protein YiiM